jgi:hypothetical protein
MQVDEVVILDIDQPQPAAGQGDVRVQKEDRQQELLQAQVHLGRHVQQFAAQMHHQVPPEGQLLPQPEQSSQGG